MVEEASDGDLMARFYDGDATAFDALSERWWKRLFGFFRKRGFSPEDCEDAVMESLIRLFLTKETMSFDVTQPLAPFLFRTAYNLSIQEWRHQQRVGASIAWLDELDDRGAQGPLPRSVLEELSLCIQTLPEPEQTYLLLCRKHGVGDLEHQEIAAVLDRSPARVTQISQSALCRMRDCMSEKEDDAESIASLSPGKAR
jgi:RNA polymerase sigma factor (sigma-70 family)